VTLQNPQPSDFPLKRLWQGLRELVVIYFVVAVLYGNLAVIVNDLPLGVQLPTIGGRVQLFDIFSVFSFYQPVNDAIFLRGYVAQGAGCLDNSPLIDLNVDEYLPHWRGEQQSRAFANHHYYYGGSPGQQKALGRLAGKIRERHNRLHPQCPVDRVDIGVYRWPRSPQGYETLRTPDQTRIIYWYPERPS
jgi:hypothetical protein